MSGTKKNMEFLIGQCFGKWKVIGVSKPKQHTLCLCQCSCGVIKNVYYTHMKSKKSLGCTKCAKPCGKDSPYFKGVEEISADWWRSHVFRGKAGNKNRKNIPVNITKEQAWDQFLKQDRKCALTGTEIEFPAVNSAHGTASLDRIDSDLGYEVGNVQWVHKDVNIMKNKFTQKRFIEVCQQVAKLSAGIKPAPSY